ncbi:CocE/NonD family hydrolase [Streptomyces sp. NPDC059697]|uniref:CocE/NonD family hydrolase n=1 Tax=Streptomyces sp. NPDC059697 TaxID=3346912 RepID=UPI0036D18499
MSTDVSGMIECRPLARIWGEDDEDAVWHAAVDLFLLDTGNAYDALACLFGVRNSFGFRPLTEGRGLPEDTSDGLRDAFNAWGGPQDAHATTWISWAEPARETVWVATGLDEDGDGKNDRVAVDIVRPGEPAAKGREIPVIMEASPYYSCCGRGNQSQKKSYDAGGQPVRFPLFYDNYFVPRGYAFVAVDLPGTSRSDGCTDAGGPIDIQSTTSVIDWLNGRAHGYTSDTGTSRAQANWTDGATGMIGKSWDGSITNGVAATGVKGLRTIVPISSISSWYDAYFSQGAWPAGSAPTPGSTPCTAGSTTNSSATTTESTASRWPTSNAPPTTGPRTPSDRRSRRPPWPSAPARARSRAWANSVPTPEAGPSPSPTTHRRASRQGTADPASAPGAVARTGGR